MDDQVRRMDAGRSARRRLAVLGVAALLALATVACGGDDSGSDDAASTSAAGGGGASTTAAEPTSAPIARESTTTTSAPDDGPGAQDLTGTWTADAADVLSANTASAGGPGAVSCTGPITMTFTEDGRFTRSGTVQCSSDALSGTGQIQSSGEWYVTPPDVLVIADTTSTGTLEASGQTLPFPDSFGDGEATWQVDGDSLEITFTIDPVGTVTQTYGRVAG